ncbi:MAG TPA: hypothetical protein PK514_10195 [Spirochaetota bacterium]|nr:hypothetical protein [Spirochaetota bacterium]
MKNNTRSCFITLVSLAAALFTGSIAFADNAGGRGVFLHGGWAGARYIASGMTGEVMADDVFAIYWNPAGLSELLTKKNLTEEQITDKAKEGNVSDISEDDLLNFSEAGADKMFFSIGMSATQLDIERDALFSGVAFNAFGGVLGVGVYTIMSNDIETRDGNGSLTGHTGYSGSVAYLSYSMSNDIFSFGATIKGIHERIGESMYAGAGTDIGIQVYLLPFLKAGFIIRDAGSFLRPYDAPDSEDRYDFIKPQIKGGILFMSDSGVRFSLCGSKKLEQDNFEYGAGIEYALGKYMVINGGLDNSFFTAGLTVRTSSFSCSYALSFDRIDNGYNNTVSLGMFF